MSILFAILGFLGGPVLRFVKALPWQVWAGAAAIIVIAIWHHAAVDAAFNQGKAQAVTEIDAANKAAEARADKGEAGVKACPPGHWNREKGRCEQ
jgi:plasmid stabilization system protein ParE